MEDKSSEVPEEREEHTEYSIVINGELAVVPHEEVSYTEVTSIAYPVAPGPDTTYTVTFRDAKEPRHDGSLVEGEVVLVRKAGTTFNVYCTSKS